MKTYGNVDFQQNQLQKVSFEVESNFPANPPIGRMVFKDKVLHVCVDISGNPVWVPLTSEISTYTYVHTTLTTTWTITHGLDTTTPVVQVYRQSDQTMLIPDTITIISNNVVEVTFGAPEVGRAVIMQATNDGNQRSADPYTHNQTSPDTTWTISHNLGYNPVVRVFVGNSEIIPDSITHTDGFTTVITFSSPLVGTARAI